ncbi:MAG: L-lactate dehydrogenase [Leptospirales bacterium]|nr:L-lactate dehydrogenase [Leptospirales bacterium]
MAEQQKTGKRKVILVGSGAVGASFAFLLLANNIVHELGIIDTNVQKAEGDVLDLLHSLAFVSPKKVYVADYSDCHDADIAVLTAGAAQKPGQTRIDLVRVNLEIIRENVTNMVKNGFKGIFLVATNPVDVLSYAVWKFSGFPESRVIGSGTILDTARLRQTIARELQIDARNVHAYVLGEHGDSEFVPWSHTYISAFPIMEWIKKYPKLTEKNLNDLFISVRDAAAAIIQRKGATYYGIAAGLVRIIETIFHNENAILPLSVLMNGEYGHKDLFISTPAIINQNGIRQVIEINLTKEEQALMDASANKLKAVIKEVLPS